MALHLLHIYWIGTRDTKIQLEWCRNKKEKWAGRFSLFFWQLINSKQFTLLWYFWRFFLPRWYTFFTHLSHTKHYGILIKHKHLLDVNSITKQHRNLSLFLQAFFSKNNFFLSAQSVLVFIFPRWIAWIPVDSSPHETNGFKSSGK